MKRILFVGLLHLCWTALMAQTATMQVTVTNDWTTDKADEPVAVKFSQVKKLVKVFAKAEVKGARVTGQGQDVPCQLDDMDGDLRADEVFFLTDLKAGEKKTFEVTLSAQPHEQQTEPRIYTALQIRDKQDKHPDVLKVEAPGKTFLFNDIYMHGITIESELTGYRIYFDERQNIDLYGKKYRRIELPVTQFYTSPEQLAEGYGVDVLWAGKAIGCGSFKDWNAAGCVPQNWTDVAVRGQRVVTTGPLRTVVEVYDLGVKAADGGTYDMHQTYTLCAGHRDMAVDVTFSRRLEQSFCTGVQKVGVTATDSVRRGHVPEGWLHPDGLAASWGCDYPDMGKKQQWPPEAIGMAVYVPQEYIRSQQEDELNYIYVVAPDSQGHIRYYVSFCADKEVEGYHTAGEWFASLDKWKEAVSHPARVK